MTSTEAAARQNRKPGMLVVMRVVGVLAVVLAAIHIALLLLFTGEEEHEKPTRLTKEAGVRSFFTAAGNFHCPPTTNYTPEEVAQHASEADLWVVVDKNVLDMSTFVRHHPGGLLIMEAAGGADAADLFAQHHSPSTVQLFQKYCVGQLKE
ncbi:hypothetical protein DQ04_00301210 [Trypanosoma grayi]|uniref:hypothetical protein n=1 Tax=Trypanosoma grayi TaxID=71804 RepID=UPI0004F41917|nr:hypothetical protein DQ04_00301210 [Trypanosoma grayi]KEG14811.1 hypothetical protein DQ04_00301210 [Trypanosoma grayi]